MPIRVALHHRSRYRYPRPVRLSPHVVRLHPAPHCRTPVPGYSLTVRPEVHFIHWQQDPYGNRLARLSFPEPARELSVEVDLVAELAVINPFDFFVESSAERFPFPYEPALAPGLVPYLDVGPGGPRLDALLQGARREGVRSIEFLVELNRRVRQEVRHVVRMEPGVQTPERTLELANGSCRDSAWLLVQLLRRLGLAARFVSGYLIQLAPDGTTGAGRDFTDLHAWAEVFLPGAGWIGMDPTSGLLAGEGYLPLACSADPAGAAAISGSFAPEDGSAVDSAFDYTMTIRRLPEEPRIA